jgi:hypothetical protein
MRLVEPGRHCEREPKQSRERREPDDTWIAASPKPVERRASFDALWLLAMTIPAKRRTPHQLHSSLLRGLVPEEILEPVDIVLAVLHVRVSN